jgi:hypothetical protein
MDKFILSAKQIEELLALAVTVAAETPPQFKDCARLTNIRLGTVLQIRAKLDEFGINWRKVMRTDRDLLKFKTPTDDQIHSTEHLNERIAKSLGRRAAARANTPAGPATSG